MSVCVHSLKRPKAFLVSCFLVVPGQYEQWNRSQKALPKAEASPGMSSVDRVLNKAEHWKKDLLPSCSIQLVAILDVRWWKREEEERKPLTANETKASSVVRIEIVGQNKILGQQ